MKGLYGVLALLLLTAAGFDASAQSRAETRNYRKAIEKADLEAYDRFLSRYPDSAYGADIAARRDTLLSISPYSEADACGIASAFIPSGQQFRAFARRVDAVDIIHALALPPDSLDCVHIYRLERRPGAAEWTETQSYGVYCAAADGMDSRAFADSTLSYEIRGERFYQLDYILGSSESGARSYVGVCYGPDSDFIGSISFEGEALPPQEGQPYRISGRSNETLAPSMDTPQMRLLAKSIDDNPLLEEIPLPDYLTDISIEWWLDNNPDAQGKAPGVKVNILDPQSSLVQGFASAKGMVQSSRYRAVIMDIRGYSVIVAYQKDDGNYVLAWAEPESKNHRTDRLLNDIRFTDPNTLNMHFYHGSRDFSYRLNLASKKVTR